VDRYLDEFCLLGCKLGGQHTIVNWAAGFSPHASDRDIENGMIGAVIGSGSLISRKFGANVNSSIQDIALSLGLYAGRMYNWLH
jgi:hypothetical protein